MLASRRRIILSFVSILMIFIIYFIIEDIANILTPIPQDPFRGLKGGSWLGYRTAYYGTILLVSSMFYSIVKRLNPSLCLKMGGRNLWLQIHIWLAIIGSMLILVHAGLPFDFKYYNPFKYIRLAQGGVAGLVGFSGLATIIIPFALTSGFIGRFLYSRVRKDFKSIFKYWRIVHIIVTGALYTTGVIHLIIVVWFKFVTL